MNEIQINKILFRASRWSGYILVFSMVSNFISGYGMTKGIIDPVLAQSLHEKWLPIPTVVFLILHILFPLRVALRKRIKDVAWVNIYLVVLSLIILIIVFYLYFL